jgi:HTH-type transcriptional repressor of NAD biosynthesis genes
MSSAVKKVCFYGPESTGKSTLAKEMAVLYQTVYVPEVSREFISTNDFTLEDIVKIGYTQTERILEMEKLASRIMFCDTDLITTQIYSRHYLKTSPPVLLELERKVSFDLYFLTNIDVPWVDDGLRDLGDRREEIMMVFKNELKLRNISYILVTGVWEERKRIVMKEIDRLLSL